MFIFASCEPLRRLWSASKLGRVDWLATRGGTDLERGYGDVRPWRPPFHASPAARKGPISSKRVSSQDPLLRKFGNFSLNSLNFHPNFSSQAPKFGNFQLTSPQIWKFSSHKPPFSEANVSSQAPHFGNPGRTPLPEKRLSAPPPPGLARTMFTALHSFLNLLNVTSKSRSYGTFLNSFWHLEQQKGACVGNYWSPEIKMLLGVICIPALLVFFVNLKTYVYFSDLCVYLHCIYLFLLFSMRWPMKVDSIGMLHGHVQGFECLLFNLVC